MEIKKNITVQERVDFVNFVVGSCEVENRHVPALFDYAWRAGVVKYFAPEAWEKLAMTRMTFVILCTAVMALKL